jgi:hypothetical protein
MRRLGPESPLLSQSQRSERSGIVFTTDLLDGGDQVEEVISAEEVGLHVEEEAIERRADRPNGIQQRPYSEGGFAGVLQDPQHERLVSEGSVDALPSRFGYFLP